MASWMFCRGSCEDKNEIHLQNGRYTNILVAIDSDVEEDDTLIEHIKDTFRTGSGILFNATHNRLYWGEIQILVPITWSRKPDVYETASYQSFGSANIRVVEGASRDPSVTNHAGCGEPGLHMTLTSGYLLQNVDTCRGKAMVREWGRLRWSLFPEHFTGSVFGEANQYDNYTTHRYEPTRCSRDLTGDMRDGDGWRCSETFLGEVDDDCVFTPGSGQTAIASLLFGSHCVDSIYQFCDQSQHNYDADNLQNYHCGRKSAWEVMRGTEDFTNENNFLDPSQVDTEPSFTILQQPVRRVVLVLDISGSMSTSNRIDKLIQSSAIFIRHYIPAGSHLGIVTFHTYATVNANLTLVEDDDSSRDVLVNALPTGVLWATCIGCGIETALNVLGDTKNGSYVLLLSDGGENRSPYIRDTISAIRTSGVVMDTIAVTNAADEQMEDLSSMTGGKPYFCSDGGSSACLTEAFLATVSERPELNFVPIPIQLRIDDVNITAYGQQVRSFFIGGGEGNDTVIAVTRFIDEDVEVIVEGPNGEYFDKYSQGYASDSQRRIVYITIPIAEAGNWTVTLVNTQHYDQTVGLMITTKQRSGTGVVSVDVILGSRNINHGFTPMLEVYALVQRNYQPVLGASAEAIIQNAGKTWQLPLSDSGKGSDKVKDDGVYSGVFLDFVGNGRYSVVVRVEGLTTEPRSENRGRRRRSVGTTVAPSQTGFMRSASGGAFVVQNYSANAPDILAPSTITDLRHTELYNISAVRLVWTAVGDDLDHGRASSYELRYCTDFTTLRTNFTECTLVDNDQLVEGNLSDIATAGVEESVTVQLPEGSLNVSHHFSLRASDEAGNVGSTSNIVSTTVIIAALADTTQAPTSGQPTDMSSATTTNDTTSLTTSAYFFSSSASRAGNTTPSSVTHTGPLISSATSDGTIPTFVTSTAISSSSATKTDSSSFSSVVPTTFSNSPAETDSSTSPSVTSTAVSSSPATRTDGTMTPLVTSTAISSSAPPGVPLTTAEEGINEPTVTEGSYPMTTDTATEEPSGHNQTLIIAISVVLSITVLGGGIGLFLYIHSSPVFGGKVHPSAQCDTEKNVMGTKEDECYVEEYSDPVFDKS
ncbi:calcium-activated chloride channel regulator 1-like [Diadema antillarum]|uniref:calcium-activated chloride channel regulator 1-like n=1 Tax=Diadema antillarum TaxID=105358 RepID=UPI003A8B1FFE